MAVCGVALLTSQHPVDKHRINTRADLRGLLEAGAVNHLVLIKNHHVGKVANCQSAASFEAKATRTQTCHFVNRQFERQQALFTHITAEHTGKGAL